MVSQRSSIGRGKKKYSMYQSNVMQLTVVSSLQQVTKLDVYFTANLNTHGLIDIPRKNNSSNQTVPLGLIIYWWCYKCAKFQRNR